MERRIDDHPRAVARPIDRLDTRQIRVTMFRCPFARAEVDVRRWNLPLLLNPWIALRSTALLAGVLVLALAGTDAQAASKKKAKAHARGKAKVEAPAETGADAKTPETKAGDAKADGEIELTPAGDGHDDFGPLSEQTGPGAQGDGGASGPEKAGDAAIRGSFAGEDALRLGPFVAPPKAFPFPLLGDERQKETFVDREGKLYKDRPYSGQVPDWNTEIQSNTTGRCKVEAQQLTWVGFQNTPDASRVYVQLEHEACGYVYRPDDMHVVIDLPQVNVGNPNLRREILTGAFPTAIDFIRAEDMGARGTRIVIALKEKRTYLSAHLGRYVFVDIAR